MLPEGVIIILMVEDTIKKYRIFQEGDDLLLVVDAPVDHFDDEVIQGFWDEVRSRGFDELIGRPDHPHDFDFIPTGIED